MSDILRFLCVLLYLPAVHCTSHSPWDFNGTTPGLEYIILGRCHEYKQINELNRIAEVDINCTKFWDKFKASFAYKDVCNETEKDYDDLFDLMEDGKKSDNLMFWSGTTGFVHALTSVSNYRYVTLEDTFSGYVANKLRWCGFNRTGGIDYDMCNKSCLNRVYWARASRNLAKKAKDTAYVLLNGTTEEGKTAYFNGSYFGREELPKLGGLHQIKKLVVYVVLDLDKEPKEKCGQGTLKQLEADALKHGIPKVECHNNPALVKAVLCAQKPDAKQCKKLTDDDYKAPAIIFIVFSVVFVLVIIALIIVILKQRKKLSQ